MAAALLLPFADWVALVPPLPQPATESESAMTRPSRATHGQSSVRSGASDLGARASGS